VLTRAVSVLTLAVLVGVTAPADAWADPAPPTTGGQCDHNPDPSCSAWGNARRPATGEKRAGSGCTWQGETVPCQDPELGSYTGAGCYWKVYDPQPALTAPAGQNPNMGRWGVTTCYTAPGSGAVTQVDTWMANPLNAPTPVALAQQALAKVHLLGARIGIAPRPGGSGAVGLPVWLWTAVAAGTWGPLTATAGGGGLVVTITARARVIVWDMGDGHRLSCANPGTRYEAGYGFAQSPTCGYVYSTPSVTAASPGGRYTITATTQWTVTWAGGGQNGTLTPTSQSKTSIRVGEIPVVVTR
jgi:hypothetical protein